MTLDRRRFGLGVLAASTFLGLGVLPFLTIDDAVVIEALAAALFPPAPGMPDGATARVAPGVATYLTRVPSGTAWQARGLLRAVDAATVPTRGARFHLLEVEVRQEVLRDWAGSDLEAERLVAHALRQLVAVGYYAHPSTWPHLGYDGPKVGR